MTSEVQAAAALLQDEEKKSASLPPLSVFYLDRLRRTAHTPIAWEMRARSAIDDYVAMAQRGWVALSIIWEDAPIGGLAAGRISAHILPAGIAEIAHANAAREAIVASARDPRPAPPAHMVERGYRGEPAPLLPRDSATRKSYPITEGVLDYFPAVIREMARLSALGNEKHNKGQPLHWSRDNSSDHENCIGRHTLERGGFEIITIDGVDHRVRHSVCRAWRACAAAQLELEAAGEAPIALTPRPAAL